MIRLAVTNLAGLDTSAFCGRSAGTRVQGRDV